MNPIITLGFTQFYEYFECAKDTSRPFKGFELLTDFKQSVEILSQENGSFEKCDCMYLIRIFKSSLTGFITSKYVTEIALLLILAKGNVFDQKNAVQVNLIKYINSSIYDMELLRKFIGDDIIDWLELKKKYIKDNLNDCNTNYFSVESGDWRIH